MGPSSWFGQVLDISLQYQLPHPLVLLHSSTAYPKEGYKGLVKKKVTDYWEQKLQGEVETMESLEFFKPSSMSILETYPIYLSANSSPYEVAKDQVQVLFCLEDTGQKIFQVLVPNS